MNKIELEIVALSHSVTQSHNYAVVLGEKSGTRRLPIVIGGFEAQAIAVAMEDMAPSRPLTHDLLKNTMNTFEIELQEVIINNLLDGIFYARLICNHNGEIIEIDSRTSDAIALAVRFECPIFTFEFILEAAGVEIEGKTEKSSSEPEEETEKPPVRKNLKELNALLQQFIDAEEYEKAAKVRDEIKKRKGEST